MVYRYYGRNGRLSLFSNRRKSRNAENFRLHREKTRVEIEGSAEKQKRKPIMKKEHETSAQTDFVKPVNIQRKLDFALDQPKLCDDQNSKCSNPQYKEKAEAIVGRRVVDINYFFQGMKKLANHNFSLCDFNCIEFFAEKKEGLQSTFIFKCKLCGEFLEIESEPSASQSSKMNVNDCIVSGAIGIGCGYAQMEELSSVLGIPFMTKNRFQMIQNNISDGCNSAAALEMKKAADEEKQLAIEANNVDTDGIPYIAVQVDGAWSKRSYRTNYSALSGVGTIVGMRTKKVLFMDVRNKYCTVCERIKEKKICYKKHVCNKNYFGSSTSMEADVIVEGFAKSIEMYGIKYLYYVGDGDSSVHRRLIESMPYAPKVVKKIECVNHLYRNFRKSLTEFRMEENKPVPLQQRRMIKERMSSLMAAVVGAANYRREQTSISLEARSKELAMDLKNAPFHVFGDHSGCPERDGGYFCKDDLESNDRPNFIPEFTLSGALSFIQRAFERLQKNSMSLLYNYNSNAVECYNSIVAKHVGGKRVNYSRGKTYGTRCAAAVLSFNTKKFHTKLHEKVCGTSPSKTIKKLEEKRGIKREMCGKVKKRMKKYSKATEDDGYGPGAGLRYEELQDMKGKFLNKLNITEEEKHNIEKETVDQGNSLKWKFERSKRLTASNFGLICNMKRTTDKRKRARQLLDPPMGLASFDYGQRMEKVAMKAFQDRYKMSVDKCGLFIDHEYGWLAASPDGLIENNGLIEIKCPSSAIGFTPEEAIKNKIIKSCTLDDRGRLSLKKNHVYMYQIQGQLHIAKRDYCIFVFYTPEGIATERIEKDDNFWKTKMIDKLKEFYMDALLPEIIIKEIKEET